MLSKEIYASSAAKLDSDVHTGGGNDDTLALQKILDQAGEDHGITLIVDGAALVTGLKLHSNTTIRCLDKSCGFYLKDGSDCAILSNYEDAENGICTHDVTIIDGTYNQNCLHQAHSVPDSDGFYQKGLFYPGGKHHVHGMEFYNIAHLTVRDAVIEDFRTYAFAVSGFQNVYIENVWLSLPNRMQGQNQDGFHFWGPGQFLTIRNVGGRVGDDFMNIGPDERDHHSSITDVLIDGVFLDEADQGIRLLSRNHGRLDRVTVRNVIGTYRSFGFYIDPWFIEEEWGNFGEIVFENIDLKPMKPNYDYRDPMLFSVGGNIDCLTLKDIRWHDPCDARAIAELGLPSHATAPRTVKTFQYPNGHHPLIKTVIIDGLTITGESKAADNAKYIQIYDKIETMLVKNVTELKADKNVSGALVTLDAYGQVDSFILENVIANGFAQIIDGEECVGTLFENAVHSILPE